MKKIIFILSIIFSLPIYADHYLVIEMNDYKQHSYSLSDKPIISFNNEKMIIETDKIELTYSISDIARYYFKESNELYIENINEDINNIHFTYTNPDYILIEGISGKEKINIYEMNGRSCIVDIIRSDDGVKVQLNELPKGIYIISVKNHSFKIIR